MLLLESSDPKLLLPRWFPSPEPVAFKSGPSLGSLSPALASTASDDSPSMAEPDTEGATIDDVITVALGIAGTLAA